MKRIIALFPLLIIAGLFVSCAKNKEVSEPAKAAKVEKTDVAKAEPVEPAPVAKEDSSPATVGDITIVDVAACRSIENRTPVAEASQFPADVGKLYVFTNVQLESSADTAIQHVWYHSGKEMAKVTLPVKGPRWRTYSSKVIDPTWTGDWRVDVTTTEDQVIKSVSFNVK